MTLKELIEKIEDLKEWYEDDELDNVKVDVYVNSIGESFPIVKISQFSERKIEIIVE